MCIFFSLLDCLTKTDSEVTNLTTEDDVVYVKKLSENASATVTLDTNLTFSFSASDLKRDWQPLTQEVVEVTRKVSTIRKFGYVFVKSGSRILFCLFYLLFSLQFILFSIF